MISIITAIYNQLPVNKLYWESLQRYTHYPFELIIIDNGSTDGSAEFFESVGAKVIRNSANYSYPYCQNQGIAIAQYDYLAFLNNDLIVCPDWDKNLLASMAAHGLEAITACGIENCGDKTVRKKFRRRWQRLKNFLGLFGGHQNNLARMHRWMYRPNWETFSAQWSGSRKLEVKEGFVGSSVVLARSALAKIGLWDERLQAADFDLYLRTKKRSLEVGDIKPLHIAMDTFIHHYIRLTLRSPYPPFADAVKLGAV